MKSCWLLITLMTISSILFAQDSFPRYAELPDELFDKISREHKAIEGDLQKQNEVILKKLKKQEEKIYKKLSKIDSSKAKELYSGVMDQYATLQKKINDPQALLQNSKVGEYIPHLDSLQTMLKFLGPVTEQKEKLSAAMQQVDAVKARLGQAADIKGFIGERQQGLKGLLATYKELPKKYIDKYLGKYSKECYYYTEKVKGIKEDIKDPEKMEKLALELLNKLPAFQKFMSENSELAALFGPASSTPNPAAMAGLQTRQSVQQLLQQQLGANPTQYIQQQMQAAQGELNSIKSKLEGLRSGEYGNGDAEMPENATPNNQKTKKFLQRLEYGFNIQSAVKQYQFPASNDLAISLGYKVHDRFVTGVGLAYKFSLGSGLKDIHFTHEGIGIRSYFDWKISAASKGKIPLMANIWITGGYEMNYWQRFGSIPQLQYIQWTRSGLIGATKKISRGKKEFKTQVLWDFLSYETNSTPVIFRVGYNF